MLNKDKADHTVSNTFQEASLNRCALRSFLKMSTFLTHLKSNGREFQSLGATSSESQSPLVLSLDGGTTNKPDQRTSESCCYDGAAADL